jgi:hypothetical protein
MTLLARLLHYANADPPLIGRAEFYALKAWLLNRYGTLVGYDTQQITKECWGTRGYDRGWIGCQGKGCPRCGGTRVFDRFWVRLAYYKWGGFGFHVPVERTRTEPLPWPVEYAMIYGRLHHIDYGRLSNEAVLWLYLLCGEWRLWWRAMTGGWHCTCRAWPMLNLQRIVAKLAMLLERRRCYCGRTFWTFGSGWCVCRRCRKASAGVSELPF